jgi:hypothetical protein
VGGCWADLCVCVCVCVCLCVCVCVCVRFFLGGGEVLDRWNGSAQSCHEAVRVCVSCQHVAAATKRFSVVYGHIRDGARVANRWLMDGGVTGDLEGDTREGGSGATLLEGKREGRSGGGRAGVWETAGVRVRRQKPTRCGDGWDRPARVVGRETSSCPG